MEGKAVRGCCQNDRETIMKTFKEYENIDKSCEECIFEHELEGIVRDVTGIQLPSILQG